ncbi:sugar ABC transporter permease [Nocardioides sp. KC13]|uniref:Sugar ABC transporter permease n=1 Tax=Nocardioides turkmenicus TaxID=2711220 RepID=A0A6M1R0J5_9ACTN|nr:sugar ABC transporter permease [Nocardioides sp. KC13]NGN93764.1 sugar ABC transporter permease [Nocardioides sp. KC13]
MSVLPQRADLRAASSKRRTVPGGWRRTGAALALISPFFLLFVVATLAPIGYATYLSLFAERSSGLGFGGTEQVFVGLDNFKQVLSDDRYLSSYLHIAIFAVVGVPLMLGLSVFVALLLDTAYARAKRFLQLGLFIPHLVPGVIAAMIWVYLYTPQVSPIIKVLGGMGFEIDLLGHTFTYPALINIVLWMGLGYNIIIYYASLQAVPREVIEAAIMDGAGEFRVAWHIKVPLIRSAVALTAIFAAIAALQLFAEPLMMAKASARSVTSDWTPNLYAYTAAFTKSGQFGAAAAASLLLALLAAGLSWVVTRFASPWEKA